MNKMPSLRRLPNRVLNSPRRVVRSKINFRPRTERKLYELPSDKERLQNDRFRDLLT